MLSVIVLRVKPLVNTEGSNIQAFNLVISVIVKNISTTSKTLY
jgi:hypothetical protein